ncbi:flagellar hook-basal body complex protein [Histidinibacterium lentulum]|uniref:Flagellar basal-body rod protein FlgF n=1 Tax=Histidinibacterium lentulum TaxID=2480588 RepID=A0A3N2R767_9RHOB|nr:flagellar hook-basal body complex protein [Histidinibacterium lentulum]ROU03248.1 flagellar hook-basal body complex protein [Histidinibacterium lentulum]
MDNAGYATLTRQSGLLAEMRIVANNIANASTGGYRAEGVTFSEYVRGLGSGHESLSMTRAAGRTTDLGQGPLEQTGGTLDLAIEGEGFFLVLAPGGERLTRAGHFQTSAEGDLVTPEGYPVLDAGGAPLFVPQGTGPIAVAADGTISADGLPLGQIGLVLPITPADLVREDGVRFRADGGTVPALEARVLQGFLESANVDPVIELARMIEVQRAYELGQSFLQNEHDRLLSAISSVTR